MLNPTVTLLPVVMLSRRLLGTPSPFPPSFIASFLAPPFSLSSLPSLAEFNTCARRALRSRRVRGFSMIVNVDSEPRRRCGSLTKDQPPISWERMCSVSSSFSLSSSAPTSSWSSVVALATVVVLMRVVGGIGCLCLRFAKSLSIASHFEPSCAVLCYVVSFVRSLFSMLVQVGCLVGFAGFQFETSSVQRPSWCLTIILACLPEYLVV